MQAYSLTVDRFLDHAAKWFQDRQIVTAEGEGGQRRTSYAELRARANGLSGALASLGLTQGDRVGTLAWNSQHHLEMYYAAMGAGLVCHTLNPRLTAAHLAAMVNEAQDRVLAVAANLTPLVNELLGLCPGVEQVIVLDGAAHHGLQESGLQAGGRPVWALEPLLAERGAAVVWGGFDEGSPAGLCYTSGTTGRPKGVLYTHRSNYLHTLRALQADAFALTAADSVLVAVPMFHANGWGLPFAAPAVGARLVLPGRQADGASLARLMREERVTVAVGVQTVWLGVVDHLEATGESLPDLQRVIIGGSYCPEALIRRLEARLGARVQTTWGMTELSPLGTASPANVAAVAGSAGRPVMGLDIKLTDAEGRTLPEQRGAMGHLKVRGHSVVDRYFATDESALDAEGFFDTGDLASLDADGNLTICGRAKDLIKSGGEWINPAEIEEIVGRHPDVAQVAVIGRAHAKWGERPLLIVEPRQGRALGRAEVVDCLRGKVADWWLPDEVVAVEVMPLAATGKIDKLRLRAEYAGEDATA